MEIRQDRPARRLAVLAALALTTLSLPAVVPAASEPQASISVTITGSGRVQSSPAGIDCGTTCTASFPLGAAVRLTGSPSGGSYLAGWGGACVGTKLRCSFVPKAEGSVTARFVKRSR